MSTEIINEPNRLATIVYDIRNSLAGITLNLYYLHEKLNPDSEHQKSLKNALEGAQQVEEMINRMLELTRGNSSLPTTQQSEQVNTLVNLFTKLLEIPMHQKNIKMNVELEKDGISCHVVLNKNEQE